MKISSRFLNSTKLLVNLSIQGGHFVRIEDAAGGGASPHYYLYYYLPPHFKKLLTPLVRQTDVCMSGNALARVQWVHKPADLWDISFYTH